MVTPLDFNEATNSYTLNNRRNFDSEFGIIDQNHVKNSFNFAYEMAFGGGHHRSKKFGGGTARKPGQIFSNAFQGKLAEFAFYDFLHSDNFPIPEPDTTILGQGEWDEADFLIREAQISVKSTKHYAHLIMLETSMWSENGEFTPDNGRRVTRPYDFFVLVRLNVDIERILKSKSYLYSKEIPKEELYACFSFDSQNQLRYDIPGYATLNMVREAIGAEQLISAGSMIGSSTIEVDNYYIQSGDLLDIQEFQERINAI